MFINHPRHYSMSLCGKFHSWQKIIIDADNIKNWKFLKKSNDSVPFLFSILESHWTIAVLQFQVGLQH